jgi:hypothetical protein
MPSRQRSLRIRLLTVGVLILASVRNGSPAPTPREAAPEYAVKAAYLYQFARYVTWPAEAFPSPESPVGICILGEDPFGNVMDRIVEGRRIMGRPIEVRRATLEEAAARCHVAFIGREERALLANWLGTLRTKPVLSVTESRGALSAGATINFVTEGSALRYDVNLEAAEESGLKIAAPMLVSARQVLGQATQSQGDPGKAGK